MILREKNIDNSQKSFFHGYPNIKPIDKNNKGSNKKSEIEFTFDVNESPEFWGSGF